MFSSGVSGQTSLQINAARRKKNEAMDEQESTEDKGGARAMKGKHFFQSASHHN